MEIAKKKSKFQTLKALKTITESLCYSDPFSELTIEQFMPLELFIDNWLKLKSNKNRKEK